MAGAVPGENTSPSEPSVAGWAGLLVPYDQPSVDGRMIRRPPGGARVRDLPIELKYQESATCGHDGAIIGLASITRTWETEDGLWGSGPFDIADPRGAELARKVHEGFVGHVSVDLGDFKTTAQQTQQGMLEAVTDWKLLSTTIVADAAMDGARIFTVSDPEDITPMSQALAVRREAAGVFSNRDRATLTFGNAPQEPAEFAPGLTLTITGATNLPWAPRDRPWDAAAAQRRLVAFCGGKDNINPECFGRGHLYRDSDADPKLIGSYKFPFADVIDGRLHAVFRGVASAASYVDRGGITSADKEALRGKIRSLYEKAGRAFKDDTITAPFDAEATTELRTENDMAEKRQAFQTEGEELSDSEVDSQVMSLAESIAASLAPQLSDTISEAIKTAIQQVVDAATGQMGGEEPAPEEEAPPVEDGAAAMSALVLRMARAHARHKLAAAGAR